MLISNLWDADLYLRAFSYDHEQHLLRDLRKMNFDKFKNDLTFQIDFDSLNLKKSDKNPSGKKFK